MKVEGCARCARFDVRVVHQRRDLRMVALKVPRNPGPQRTKMVNKIAEIKQNIRDEHRHWAWHHEQDHEAV